jgi:hypothetical protein
MPIYQRTTSIVFDETDLPQRPGDTVTHEIGPYVFLIDFPALNGVAVLPKTEPAADGAEHEAESDKAQFVPVLLTLKRTNYQHAAKVIPTAGGRGRVADFALCNGKADSRAVAGRLRNATLDVVDCPRCLKWLQRAGITTAKMQNQG